MKPIRSGYEQTKVVDEPKVSELNSTTELLSFEIPFVEVPAIQKYLKS